MSKVLIYSEKSHLAAELVSAARSMNAEAVFALSVNDDGLAASLASMGAHVYKAADPGLQLSDIQRLAAAVSQAAEKAGADIVLLSSNRRGKELSGRVAHLLGAGCLNDVLGLKVNGTAIECLRNSFGGATVATQTVVTGRQVIAISPKSFEAAAEGGAGQEENLVLNLPQAKLALLSSSGLAADAVDLEAAEVIVAIGLGADADDLKDAEELAAALGGAVGCSKPVATDRKLLPEDRLIGLSGNKCKPDLAVMLGISGQVQFMVGIREAKTIVSINIDENANMMQMADYRLVGKIKDVLPELVRAVKG